MPYTIEFASRARRQIESMPKSVQEALAPIISSLASNPRPPGIQSVRELDKCYRLRHGDYRIVYAVHDKVLLVLMLAVANRREVYSRQEITAIRRELRRRLRHK